MAIDAKKGIRRIGRQLVLAGSGITVATAAIALLALTPVNPAPRHLPPSGPTRDAKSGAATPGAAPAPARSIPLAPGRAPVAPVAPAAPPAPRARAVSGAPTRPGRPSLPPQLAGMKVEVTWEAQVTRAADAFERLKVLDGILHSADPLDAIGLIQKLLDKTPGANAEETATLRIGLVTRLGLYKTNQLAWSRLTAELDAANPRPERLTALDALARDGNVPPSARPALEKLAADEPDPEVRQRVRAALGITDAVEAASPPAADNPGGGAQAEPPGR